MASVELAALAKELRPPGVVRSLAAGLVIFVLELGFIASFAALVYGEATPEALPQGIALLVVGNAILVLVLTLFSAYRGTISLGQDLPAAILGLAAVSVAASVGSAAFPTVTTMVVLTTIVAGLVFAVLGAFKLGNLVRFLPYPVMGGFLAGTGYLLVAGGVGIVTTSAGLELVGREALVRWLPAMLMGTVLFITARRTSNPLWLPLIMIATILLFYATAVLRGQSPADLAASGWLVASELGEAGGLSTTGLWHFPVTAGILAQVEWPAIWRQVPVLAPMILISAIAMLLNTNGLELIIGRDLDLNRELMITGAANVLSGLGGGIIGYHAISSSSLNHALAPNRRLPGLLLAGLLLLAMLFGAELIGYIPRLVLAGLVIFVGLQLLADWVYDAWFRFPLVDFLIIVLILITIAWQGFLIGVVVGTVAALVMFVINYSRTNVVRQAVSGDAYRSRVTRSPASVAALTELCLQIYILRLQGFIFFGTANTLLDNVRRHIGSSLTRYIIFDFTHVNGLDSTALLSFDKMRLLAAEMNVTLVLAGMAPALQKQIVRGGFGEEGGNVRFFTTLDAAVGWCEDELLKTLSQPAAPPNTLAAQLEFLLPGGASAHIIPYLTRLTTAAGDILVHQGDAPDYLYFIESGQVTAQLQSDGQEPTRLETMQGGRVVGELGFYLGTPRTAAVVVDEPGVVYSLSRQALDRMRAENPAAIDALQQIIIRLISERLVQLTRAFQAYS